MSKSRFWDVFISCCIGGSGNFAGWHGRTSWNPEELASSINRNLAYRVSERTVRDWFQGKSAPDRYHFERLIEVFFPGDDALDALIRNEKEALVDSYNELVRSIQEPPALQIFLCHAFEDKEAVRTLYRRLLLFGFDPWLDAEKLLPGQDWNAEITKVIRAAHVVLVCLSQRSGRRGYVQKEIVRALDVADEQPEGTIFLIPVHLEDCHVPERLRRWQWVDLFEDNGVSKLRAALELSSPTRVTGH
jgi:TIR domain